VQVLVAARQESVRDVASAAATQSGALGFHHETDVESVLSHLNESCDRTMLLLDFNFPGLTGLKGIQIARKALGERPLGVFMHGSNFELAKRALSAGAQGIFPRDMTPEDLASSIKLLKRGQCFAIVGQTESFARMRAADDLSERELQVLDGVARGMQNKEIAHSFQIQEVTVKMHVRAIIRKLDANNRTHAAMIARDLGII
jgi:two-component system, NarL family, nitrate/nitrite response regulator NarL